MAEGEHTIISKIPRERLNQIAGRKLTALQIPVRLGADRETLEGELPFSPGKVLHPATGAPIARARFTVVGHDHLRFLDPPLAALPPLQFYDADRAGVLEAKVVLSLQKRAAGLQEIAARMRAIKLATAVDADRLAVRAVVQTTGFAFEVLGTPEAVRVTRVAPVGGQPFEVPPSYPALDLGEFPQAVDLELHLAHAVPAMLEAAKRAAAEAKTEAKPEAHEAVLEPMPAPRTAVTLAMLAQKFGSEVMLSPNAPVEVVQEFTFGGTRYRFVATRDMGTTFKGRLIGPNGDKWSEKFDLTRFPGTVALVASLLGGAPAQPRAAPAAPAEPSAPVPSHLQPHPGEVWVMNVVVEQDDGDEVRYVGTDIDGRPYGAARVLKKSDFEAVFSSDKGGWRLLIAVDQLQGDAVIYRQLDRQRQPIGAPKKMATAILVANFVPEAAAY